MAPVFVEALHHELLAIFPIDELVLTGADGGFAGIEILRGHTLRGVCRNDEHVRKIVWQHWCGHHGLHLDGVVIELDDPFDVARELRKGVGRIGYVGHALPSEDHIVSRKRCAIVEHHAFAQLDFPRKVVDIFPGRSQLWARHQFFIEHSKLFIDEFVRGAGGKGGKKMWVKRIEFEFGAEGEGLCARGHSA